MSAEFRLRLWRHKRSASVSARAASTVLLTALGVAAKAVTDAALIVTELELVEPIVAVSANPDLAHGRGLAIVEAYSQRWGVVSHPDDGKTVWVEVKTDVSARTGSGQVADACLGHPSTWR